MLPLPDLSLISGFIRRLYTAVLAMHSMGDRTAFPGPKPVVVLGKLLVRLRRSWDLLGVAFLMLASIPAVLVLPKTLVLVAHPGFMDDDWHLDAGFKASRGIWIGRDVAFTHGPLFQWISSLPARLVGVSTGTLYATWNTVPVWCTILFVYLTLVLVIPDQPPWVRFFLLSLVCVFWSPSLRISCATLIFVVFLRAFYAARNLRTKVYLAGLLVGSLCAGAFIVSPDTGTFAVAAVLAAAIGIAFEFRSDLRALRGLALLLLSAGMSWLAAALAINTVLDKPFDFRFWKDSLAIISTYRWATPYPMSEAGTMRLAATLLCGAGSFGIAAFRRLRRRPGITDRAGFLLGGALFCLLLMQSALVRSDEHHVGPALLPTVLFSGAILFSFDSKRLTGIVTVVALGCSVMFGQMPVRAPAITNPEHVVLTPANIRELVSQLRRPLRRCPAGFAEFDRACFPEGFARLLQASATFLEEHSGPQDSIAIFPYQTRYGLAARRNVAGGLMQAYTATGPTLAEMEIRGLEQAPTVAGLYFPDADFNRLSPSEVGTWRDSDLSVAVDGVSNFTRAPEVWFWMQHRYRAERQIGMGIVALQQDDSRRQRIVTQAQSLALPAQSYPVDDRRVTLNLGDVVWPRDADFIRLRLTVRYPFWWKLRKPERLQLEILRADGSTELQWFVLAPNVSSEVWFYPWSPVGLEYYFDADPARWHVGRGSPITSLKLLISPLDWVSQQPDSVAVEAADAISLQMAP